jgi:hypothetical protein
MIRTQISFEQGEYERAKKEAKARGISLAESVRLAVRERLRPARRSRHWMRYAGDVDSGDPYSSQTIDDVVCGSKD